MPNDPRDIDRLIEGAFEHDRSDMPVQPSAPDASLLDQLARSSTLATGAASGGGSLGSGFAASGIGKLLIAIASVAVVGSAVYVLTRTPEAPLLQPAPVQVAVPIDSPISPRAIDTTPAQSALRRVAPTSAAQTTGNDTSHAAPISAEDNLLPPTRRKVYKSDSANVPLHQGRRQPPK